MFPDDWQGWSFYDRFLLDPDGNRYTPEMVASSLFTFQLKHELTGSTGSIASLKEVLLRQTQPLTFGIEISIDRARRPSVKVINHRAN